MYRCIFVCRGGRFIDSYSGVFRYCFAGGIGGVALGGCVEYTFLFCVRKLSCVCVFLVIVCDVMLTMVLGNVRLDFGASELIVEIWLWVRLCSGFLDGVVI